MAKITNHEDLLALIPSRDVTKAYVGKRGCMCGCNGRYFFTTASQAHESKQHGYEVTANDKRVNQILQLIRDADFKDLVIDESYVGLEREENGKTKMYFVWFTASFMQATRLVLEKSADEWSAVILPPFSKRKQSGHRVAVADGRLTKVEALSYFKDMGLIIGAGNV